MSLWKNLDIINQGLAPSSLDRSRKRFKAPVFAAYVGFFLQGYRSLAEGEAVEFELETDHTGRKKAINVSGPGGAAVKASSLS